MLCALARAIIGFTIVVHIVAQMSHRVVGTVAANRTGKMQFIGQAVLLNEAVGSQRHGAALRVAYAYALPVVLEIMEREETLVIFKQCQSVAHGIHYLTCRQLLIKVRVGTVLTHTITLVVGQDNQTTGITHGIVTRIVYQHARIGHPRKCTTALIVLRGTLVVACNGNMTAYNQIVGLSRRVFYQHPRGHSHQRRQRHLVTVGIHRWIGIGVEFGSRERCRALTLHSAGTPTDQRRLWVFVGTNHNYAFFSKVGIIHCCNFHVGGIHRPRLINVKLLTVTRKGSQQHDCQHKCCFHFQYSYLNISSQTSASKCLCQHTQQGNDRNHRRTVDTKLHGTVDERLIAAHLAHDDVVFLFQLIALMKQVNDQHTYNND